MSDEHKEQNNLQARLRSIIFDADTPAGKSYDIILIIVIALAVIVVMLDSVSSFSDSHSITLKVFEWFFTIAFTADYIIRLYCVGQPKKYATSFFGVIDLLAVIPTYLSLFIPGTQYLIVIRLLRFLRIFRIFKLVSYSNEAKLLIQGLNASRRKITVFLLTVLTMVAILGSLMYVIEGSENGFTSIPRSIYWAIVTLTTVGYGDISPATGLGQALAALVMILGYSIIAVPAGIITLEAVRTISKQQEPCSSCGKYGHDIDASHCKYCGQILSS